MYIEPWPSELWGETLLFLSCYALNIAIKYPELSPNRKSDIFLHFVNQLDEESVLDKERIHAWIKEEEGREEVSGLNGRQIRNIVFSAARMSAVQEGGKLSLAAIKQLTQATKKFLLDIQADMAASRVKNEPMNSTM
ncbi:hypothetical protein SUNI508_11654 [Seiridium unicorne]|uniref:Uncharacterized protein n=1 Tax=Seiridium unicorne TaxID=138068 RepID=A0ABR2UH80_9PEZI